MSQKRVRLAPLQAALRGVRLVSHWSLQPRPFLNVAVHARCGVPLAYLSKVKSA